MPASSVLPVVCAVLEDATGRVLVAQRPAHKHLGLQWEFPGGKVEPGESPSAALQRELREELGCTVTIVRPLPVCRHDYGSVVIALTPFVCRLDPASTAPVAHEHAALQWIAPTDLTNWPLAAADLPVVQAYRAQLSA